jgi:hypothetical protein
MNSEEFFLHTMGDLDYAIQSHDEYTIIKASGRLRLLLIDGNCLMDVVNRPHLLKIAFDVSDPWHFPGDNTLDDAGLDHLVMIDAISPDSALPNKPTLRLKRDAFLNFSVAKIKGLDVSIHDVIDRCAHVEGGIHYGRLKSEGEKALVPIQEFEVNGVTFNMRQLLPILKIVRKALIPLEEILRSPG